MRRAGFVTHALGWLGWCAAAMFGGACGKAEGGDAGGDGAVEASAWPGRVAELQCESLNDCCSQQGFQLDVAGCEALVAEGFQAELDIELRPGVSFDTEAAGECLASLRVACGDFVPGSPLACKRLFVGSLSLGEACSSGNQCLGAERGFSSCSGVCVAATPVRHGQLGQACLYTCDVDVECSTFPGEGEPPSVACYPKDGFYCGLGGGTEALGKSCRPLVPVGQPCSVDSVCVGDAVCVKDGVCAAPLADGAACDVESQCRSRLCHEGVCGRGPTVSQSDCALN